MVTIFRPPSTTFCQCSSGHISTPAYPIRAACAISSSGAMLLPKHHQASDCLILDIVGPLLLVVMVAVDRACRSHAVPTPHSFPTFSLQAQISFVARLSTGKFRFEQCWHFGAPSH